MRIASYNTKERKKERKVRRSRRKWNVKIENRWTDE